MDELVIILIRGIGVGAVYSLVAMSFNIVSNASGILNFAQGNLLVLGGLCAYFLLPGEPDAVQWAIGLPLAALALALFHTLQGWLTLLPLRSSVEQHSWLITTMAVSVMIGAVILVWQGPFALNVRSPFANFPLLGTRTPMSYPLAVALAIFWYGALRWFHARTRAGLAMSALAQDLDAARAAGLHVKRLQMLAFAISGLIIGSAGFVAAPVIKVSADSGISYVLSGFIAAVIGGLGSNLGALVGGPLVGVAAMFAAFRFGGQFQNAFSLALLIVVLMLRPQGLLGRVSARRV
jgi:branched-chain amino acid transport system permease protein